MSARTRDSVALAGGSAATGLLAYVVFALTTRGLSAADAAPVSVLWSYWAVAGAALTFPLQHWVTRSVPAHGEAAVRGAAARLVTTVVLLSAVATSVAWLVREPLFGRSDLWFPAMVGMVTIGSALVGVTRGVLGARRRFIAVATSMASENAVRCLAAGVLLTAEVRSPVGYGMCLIVGHLVVVLWPSAFWLGSSGETDRTSPFAFLVGAGFGQISAQVVLTSGTVLLALTGGSPAQVTALFAALALFRAPYMVALGVMPQLMSRMTAVVLTGDVTPLRRLAASGVAATVVAVPAAALLAAWIGPELLELVFGAGVRLDAVPAALTAAGCTLAISNLVLMVTAMAQDHPLAVARAWVAALGGGVLAFVLLGDLAPLERVVWTLVAAETVALTALMVVNGVGRRSAEQQSRA